MRWERPLQRLPDESLRKDMIRGCAFRCFWAVAGSLLLGVPLSGQTSIEKSSAGIARETETHLGYSQDWSSGHRLIPGARVEDGLAARNPDPRYLYNRVRRQAAIEKAPIVAVPPRRTKIDWAVSLENGYVPQNQYPAKFQFGIGAESCDSDYVVFGLTVTGMVPQANLVGIN